VQSSKTENFGLELEHTIAQAIYIFINNKNIRYKIFVQFTKIHDLKVYVFHKNVSLIEGIFEMYINI
jgi:hypothetical protein